MSRKLLVVGFLFPFLILAQFPDRAGSVGSTAIPKDSSAIIAWATGCTLTRGFRNISNQNLGLTTVGSANLATGAAGTNGVVSLGDGGSAILTFQHPIKNGEGFDFAVFENAFIDTFLELAFVEVSSDGTNYVRFPATSNTQTSTQIGPFDNLGDATKINNLAGKYKANFGTPFDLNELSGNSILDINAITHVKIIDVVGSINPLYASYDKNNTIINDPFPTGFDSGGFDLDAVGVIHQNTTNLENENTFSKISIFPNPLKSNENLNIQTPYNIEKVIIYNSQGTKTFEGNKSNLSNYIFAQGVYNIEIQTKNGNFHKKIIAQ
jgi:hypothetical protein